MLPIVGITVLFGNVCFIIWASFSLSSNISWGVLENRSAKGALLSCLFIINMIFTTKKYNFKIQPIYFIWIYFYKIINYLALSPVQTMKSNGVFYAKFDK